MSSTNVDSSHSPASNHTPLTERPLIVAAYRFGDPTRKRRVKVPINIAWRDFLGLFYSRLNISPEVEIEIFDEQGIEIVSVEDLVENDVLVIRDRRKKMVPPLPQVLKASGHSSTGYEPSGRSSTGYDPRVSKLETRRLRVSSGHVLPHREGEGLGARMSSLAVAKTTSRSRDPREHSPSTIGVPQLAHFIHCNSFGYYFLAEVDNMKILPSHGKIRRTHCIVKVPHLNKTEGSFQTFECEANLLRRISGHKCIISAPSVQILNFSNETLHRFLSGVPPQKQLLLRDLVVNGGCTEAYVYPLYGVTMATKIKTGLTPDKALKYAFQLADIMNYLHQRGVIHQNLLPENVQVMSNDRAMLCNFETAIQADPSSCLLVVSRSVVAPSNKKGLAPEVISAFAREETETIDFSTQYPWSFGVLAVLMATGHHPLKDYPVAYEVGGRREGREREVRVKYRSANYQALPDANQYPGSFCRLVRRSLSCDPTRRPTLVQILQVMKRDSKIVSLMTGKTKERGGASDIVGGAKGQTFEQDIYDVRLDSAQQARDGGDPYSHGKYQSLRPQPHSHSEVSNSRSPSLPYNRSLSATFPTDREGLQYRQSPRKRSKTDAHSPYEDNQSRDSLVRSCDPQTRPQYQSLISRGAHLKSAGSYGSLNHQGGQVATSSSRHQWFSFEDPTSSPSVTPQYPSGARNALRQGSLQRYGSQGAFSDDFVTPNLSHGSSDHSDRRSSDSLRVFNSLRQSKTSCTTSESDLSQLQEFQYQRLITTPSPNLGAHFDREEPSPSYRSDQDRLLRMSSPELGLDTESVQGFPRSIQEFTNGMQVLATSAQGVGVQRSASSPQGYSIGAQEYPSVLQDDARSTSDETMDGSNTTEADQTPELPRATIVSRNQVATISNRLGSSPLVGRPNTAPQDNEAVEIQGEHRWATMEPHPLLTPGLRTPESSQEFMDTETTTTGHSLSHDSHVTMSQDAVTMSQGEQSRASTAEMDTATASDRSQSTDVAATTGAGRSTGQATQGERPCVFQVGGSPEEDVEVTTTAARVPLQHPQSGSSAAEIAGGTSTTQSYPNTFSIDGSLARPLDLSAQHGSQESATGGVGSHSGAAAYGHSQPLGDDMDTPKISRSGKAGLQVAPNDIFQIAGQEGGELVPGDEELTPRLSVEVGEEGRRQEDTFSIPGEIPALQIGDIASNVAQAGSASSATSAQLDSIPSHLSGPPTNEMAGPGDIQGDQRAYPPSPVGVGTGYMSPIPEASQECSSQTQTTTDQLTSSHSPSDETEEALRQRSVSPFRHSALDDRASTPKSQSTVSDHGSTAQASTVTALTALRIQVPLGAGARVLRGESPHLEPPSSDTSYSGTTNSSSNTSGATSTQVRNSEVSTQAHVSGPHPHTLLLPPPPRRENKPVSTATARVQSRPPKRAWSEVRIQTNRSTTPARSNVSAPSRVEALGSLSPRSGSQLSASALSPSSGGIIGQSVQLAVTMDVAPPEMRLTDYPRTQHRISQDLEMMNLAIAGMDSQGSSGDSGQQTERPSRSQPYTRVTIPSSSGPIYPLARRPDGSTAITGHSSRPASTTRTPLEGSRSFRPISLSAGEQRSFSAGPSLGDEKVAYLQQRISDQQLLAPSGVRSEQRSSVPPPQVTTDSYDYLPPYAPRQDGDIDDHSPAPVHSYSSTSHDHGNQQQTAMQQQQYQQQQQQHQQQQHQQQQHQQQQHQQQQHQQQQHQQQQQQHQQRPKTPPLYPEPPPSYEDIFGPRQANRKNRRGKQQGYSTSRQHRGGAHPELRRISSSQANAAPTGEGLRVLSRQGSGPKRLTSLTNLFRRSRSRHSQDLTPSGVPGGSELQAGIEGDHTASWVASYERTPRPQLMAGSGLPDFSRGSSSRGGGGRDAQSVVSMPVYSHAPSLVSHTISDTTASRPVPSRNPPVPYRNPPPFPSAENVPQMSPHSSPFSAYPRTSQSRGGVSILSSNAPSDVHSTPPISSHTASPGYNRGPVTRRSWSHDRQARPRPYSEIMASEDVEIFQPSSGLEGLGGNGREGGTRARGNLSSSCFDISSQPIGGQTQLETATPQSVRNRPSSARPSTTTNTSTLISPGNPTLFSNANGNNTNASQTVSPCASPTNPSAAGSGASQSNSSTTGGGLSSRSSARMRALSRRAQQAASQYSSSDDDALNQEPRRMRRRRGHEGGQKSGNSQSPAASQEGSRVTSQGSHDHAAVSHDHAALSCVRVVTPQGERSLAQAPMTSTPTNVGSARSPDQPDRSHDQETGSHDQEATTHAQATVHPSVQETESNGIAGGNEVIVMETQTGVEQSSAADQNGTHRGASEASTPTSSQPGVLNGRSKTCGHRCISGEQELCCLCMKEQQGSLEIVRLLQNCQACERRTTTDDSEPLPPGEHAPGCICLGNKRNTSCPVHSNQTTACTPAQQPSLHVELLVENGSGKRSGKHCLVM